MVKAVVFDCFGVLTRDGWSTFRDANIKSPDNLELASAANKRVDAGIISYQDYISELVNLSGKSGTEVKRALETHSPNEALLSYIRDNLVGRVKIGMLSNAADNWLDDIFEPWQVDLFDEVVLSYQLGVTKPNRLMYETICNRLGILPDEAIFIDDYSGYTEGARDVGMYGIHYKTVEQTIQEIEELTRA